MKLTVRRLLGAGGVAAAILVAFLAWWLWPAAAPDAPPVAEVEPEKKKIARATIQNRHLEERTEGDILEELGIDPEITPNCALINQWHHRNVSLMTIMDNMSAGAMVFHNEELNCLEGSPLPPAVLRWAEFHIDHNTNKVLAELEWGPAQE